MTEHWRRWHHYLPMDDRTRMLIDLVADMAEDGEQGGEADLVIDPAHLRDFPATPSRPR